MHVCLISSFAAYKIVETQEVLLCNCWILWYMYFASYSYPTRGKTISLSVCLCVCVCMFVGTKIARSRDLGVIEKCKYHYSVGKVGKLTCTFFSLLDA